MVISSSIFFFQLVKKYFVSLNSVSFLSPLGMIWSQKLSYSPSASWKTSYFFLKWQNPLSFYLSMISPFKSLPSQTKKHPRKWGKRIELKRSIPRELKNAKRKRCQFPYTANSKIIFFNWKNGTNKTPYAYRTENAFYLPLAWYKHRKYWDFHCERKIF